MNTHTIRIVLFSVIILCLSALLGWYFFLSSKQNEIIDISQGRGIGVSTPTSAPTGSSYSNIVAGSRTTALPTLTTEKTQSSRIWHVTTSPVAGMGFVQTGAVPTLYFVERGTGYVLSAQPQSRTIDRLTNTLFPQTYEASVSTKGSVILRTVDEREDVVTFVGKVQRATSSVGALVGITLEKNITFATWGLDGTRVVYEVPTEGSGSSLYSSTAEGTQRTLLMSSGVRDWNAFWGDALYIIQKPSRYAFSTLFTLEGGSLTSIEKGRGLSARIRGSSLLTGTLDPLPRLEAHLPGTSSVTLPYGTITDKCTWIPTLSPQKKYEFTRIACAVPLQIPTEFPDSWYQGVAHTDDTWKVWDTRTGTGKTLEVPLSTPPLDVESPVADDTGVYIAFMDARDKSLWVVQITE